MADRRQPPHVRVWQSVLNEHWPADPLRFRNRDDPRPVHARVVFDRDGETWLEGRALRWDDTHVW